jgi:hypothetical protein
MQVYIYFLDSPILSFPSVDSQNVSTEVCYIISMLYISTLLMYLIRVLDCNRYCTNTVDSQNVSTESSGL